MLCNAPGALPQNSCGCCDRPGALSVPIPLSESGPTSAGIRTALCLVRRTLPSKLLSERLQTLYVNNLGSRS